MYPLFRVCRNVMPSPASLLNHGARTRSKERPDDFSAVQMDRCCNWAEDLVPTEQLMVTGGLVDATSCQLVYQASHLAPNGYDP